MMTRSGSPATVIKKSAKAGPKATKVHPKNTAAPIAWQLGAGWRPGQGRQIGGARQLESPRGVATRPRKGRGAMSPPNSGEGEGESTKTPNTSPRDFFYGSRGGHKPLPQPCGHLPSNSPPPPPWPRPQQARRLWARCEQEAREEGGCWRQRVSATRGCKRLPFC